MNSTTEAISYGVPMLAFPQMPEQVVNAERIVELGIGRRLDPESLTAEGLRRAVDDLTTSTEVAARLERLRADARAGGGAAAGADAIEQHVPEDLSRSRPRLCPGTGTAHDHRRTDPMAHGRRFDHIGITVADLAAATAFFVGLGLEVEGTGTVEGEFVETVCAIPGARCEIAMLRPPDGGARLELSSFVTPDHVPGSPAAMANELGLRNVSFEVGDLDAVVEELAGDGYGLVGGIGEYEDSVRMAYVRGPEGIIVSLFEQIG
jgi:catechol 2,3-dioxygenase-like lactoylglutathione lyase family enzyme